MGQRLTLDSNVVGYWGFDEALETDPAVDSTANGLNLAVTNSNGALPGRVGNARRFDGSTSFASVTSALLRLTGSLTLMGWVRLNTYNGAGTQLRCIVSCGGPTTGDNSLYALNVTLSGALQYRHTAAGGEVVVQTAAGTIRTGQTYFVQVRRVVNGGGFDVEIFVDNVQKAPAVITLNGSPTAFPVPGPAANASAVFSVGRSQKEANSAFWDGLLDEISVHDVARPYHAYLIDAHFRAALRSTTTKLSASNTVLAVSTSEMGAGVRWWVFERDKDLYAVKESPFGQFGSETRLTTVGGGNSSLTGQPELLYDAATDTLYVFFVSGNRIYKLTANSTDDPATINMPYTADTGTIIKSVDNVDGARLGWGGGQREPLISDFTQTTFGTVKLNLTEPTIFNLGWGGSGMEPVVVQGTPNTPQLAFLKHPTLGFGFVIGPVDSEEGGYLAYYNDGGAVVAMAAPTPISDSRFFVPIATRVSGRGYFAEALSQTGMRTGVLSEVLYDRFGLVREVPGGTILQFGNDGDGFDREGANLGWGGGMREVLLEDFSYVNRAPVKMSTQDPDMNNLGSGGAQSGSVTNGTTNRPVDSGKVVQTE